MKFQAHRGVSSEYPENTMPAYRAALVQGYENIELDPKFTADGVCVVFHDRTLNRTCRNADGTPLAEERFAHEATWDEISALDAGRYMGDRFAGTGVPLLAEVLAELAKEDVLVKIDNRIEDFTEEQNAALFDIVEASGARVGFTCTRPDFIRRVTRRFPSCEIHYDGVVTEENLRQVQAVLERNPLTVWLQIAKPQADGSVDPAYAAQCELCKRYGALGLWMLDTREELDIAYRCGADVIETSGCLKPERQCGLYDCHTHTGFSHDSQQDPVEAMRAAAQFGLSGYAITDHCDIQYNKDYDVFTPILQSAQQAAAMNTPEFTVLRGVELGEPVWDREALERVLGQTEYDVVIASSHAARYPGHHEPYSHIDFTQLTEEETEGYLAAYFEEVRETAETVDYDILAHLTCPLRYITGKWKISVDLEQYRPVITEILKTVIRRDKALEVNTSGLNAPYGEWMPDPEILKLYRSLGGSKITIGSDGHTAERIANGFAETRRKLVAMGFTRAYYYRNRQPVAYELRG